MLTMKNMVLHRAPKKARRSKNKKENEKKSCHSFEYLPEKVNLLFLFKIMCTAVFSKSMSNLVMILFLLMSIKLLVDGRYRDYFLIDNQ